MPSKPAVLRRIEYHARRKREHAEQLEDEVKEALRRGLPERTIAKAAKMSPPAIHSRKAKLDD